MNPVRNQLAAPTASSALPRPGGADIEIRRATPADRPLVDEFINATYEDLAPFKMGRRFDWQFLENPVRQSGLCPYWIAIDKARGLVAGAIAVQEGNLLSRGHRHRAGWVVDVMVRPEYRGQGLGHRIHERVANEFETMVTLTMAPATRRIIEKHGCVTLGSVIQLDRPLHVTRGTASRYLRHRTKNRPRLNSFTRAALRFPIVPAICCGLCNAWSAAARLLHRTPRSQIQVTEAPELNASDCDFLVRLGQDRQNLFERSPEFMQWRFCKSPDLQYEMFRATRGAQTAGMVVLRVFHAGEMPVGTIVDILSLTADREILDALVHHAIRHFTGRVELVDAAASAPDVVAALRRACFAKTRTMKPTLVSTDPRLVQEVSQDAGKWFFSKADHDWDQVHIVPL